MRMLLQNKNESTAFDSITAWLFEKVAATEPIPAWLLAF
jgi:hypothetical protein